jgi:hypothetical protein
MIRPRKRLPASVLVRIYAQDTSIGVLRGADAATEREVLLRTGRDVADEKYR